MDELSLINVKVEDCEPAQINTGNTLPLLNEIRYALETLIETNKTTVIDLLSIPLAPGEEEGIEKVLGIGEVTAQLNSLGTSDIYESRFPGVWLIVHYNSNEEIMGKLIDITWIPSILCAQQADVKQGLSKLTQQLDKSFSTNGIYEN